MADFELDMMVPPMEVEVVACCRWTLDDHSVYSPSAVFRHSLDVLRARWIPFLFTFLFSIRVHRDGGLFLGDTQHDIGVGAMDTSVDMVDDGYEFLLVAWRIWNMDALTGR